MRPEHRRGARPLLQVPLDRALGADGGAVGVLAGVAAGPALTQQVPALVEGDLDLVEAGLLGLVEALADGLALEGVLLLDQGADAVHDLLVVHGAHSTASAGGRGPGGSLGSGHANPVLPPGRPGGGAAPVH